MSIITTKSDVVWNYIGTLFGMASGFLLLPILMAFLPPDYLSLWYIFLSLCTIVSLLNSGLGPSLSRNVMYAWGGADAIQSQGIANAKSDKPNMPLLRKVLDASKCIHAFTSSIALILLAVFGTVYIRHITQMLPFETILPAWIIFCAAIFLNLYYDYWAVFLRGIGLIASYNKILVASKICDLGIATALLVSGHGIVSVAISYFVSGCVLRLLSKRVFAKRVDIKTTQPLKSRIKETKEVVIILWPNSWRDWLVAIADAITTQAMTIVCSLFLSLTDAGIYALSLQFITAIAKASDAILFSYQPEIANCIVLKRYERACSLVSMCMIVYGILFILATVAVIALAIPLLYAISDSYQFDIPTLLLLAVYMYLLNRYKLYAAVIALTNNLCYWKSFIVSGVAGLVLSIVALSILGSSTYTLIASQLVMQCAYNIWKWPRFARSTIGCNSFKYFFNLGRNELTAKVRLAL